MAHNLSELEKCELSIQHVRQQIARWCSFTEAAEQTLFELLDKKRGLCQHENSGIISSIDYERGEISSMNYCDECKKTWNL